VKLFALALLIAALAPPQLLDSQAVLQRYEAKLAEMKDPQTLIFMYAVSQAGPQDIDQTHRVYRSGNLVRDETLIVDGVTQKFTRIARYRNRYTLQSLAPRSAQYVFLFVRPIRTAGRYDYFYRAVPLGAPTAFTVKTMTIDGRSFLPREIRFHSTGVGARGGVVDEEALIAALDGEKIRAAAIDVVAQEPLAPDSSSTLRFAVAPGRYVANAMMVGQLPFAV